MLPLKKILWPTDFSEPANQALKSVEELAKSFDATIYGLHVNAPIPAITPPGPGQLAIPEPAYQFDIPLYEKQLADGAKQSLDELLKKPSASGLKVVALVEIGDPASVIVELAKKEAVDLIVMATHGRTGLPHFFLGSVAEKVVRLSTVPVLTIRADVRKKA